MTRVRQATNRSRLLAVLGLGELLAMSPWFSASAVAPLITAELSLSGMDLPMLTIAVQLGFVVGALLLAVTGAADVLPARALFSSAPSAPRSRASASRISRTASAGLSSSASSRDSPSRACTRSA